LAALQSFALQRTDRLGESRDGIPLAAGLSQASFQLLGFDVMLDCKLRPWYPCASIR
jgi:hypothetical protein